MTLAGQQGRHQPAWTRAPADIQGGTLYIHLLASFSGRAATQLFMSVSNRRKPPADSCYDLDQQLARFQHIYNQERPHRALDRKTPSEVYTSLPKAAPRASSERHWRVRYDKIDDVGTVSLRYESTMRHLAIGRAHKGKHVIILIAGTEVMIADTLTGELLAEHTIDRNKSYQAKK